MQYLPQEPNSFFTNQSRDLELPNGPKFQHTLLKGCGLGKAEISGRTMENLPLEKENFFQMESYTSFSDGSSPSESKRVSSPSIKLYSDIEIEVNDPRPPVEFKM